jgi:antitoxin PrlF
MHAATVTSKGQITLPSEMRKKLRLIPGSKLVFEEQPNGDFVVRRKTVDVSSLRGILKAPAGFTPTQEDIDAGIARAVADRDARSRH